MHMPGCDRCFSMDGNWKLCFPHCMYPVTAGVPGLPTLNVPNICPSQLKQGSAFCEYHYEVAQKLNYPTHIKGFLRFCGITQKSGKFLTSRIICVLSLAELLQPRKLSKKMMSVLP